MVLVVHRALFYSQALRMFFCRLRIFCALSYFLATDARLRAFWAGICDPTPIRWPFSMRRHGTSSIHCVFHLCNSYINKIFFEPHPASRSCVPSHAILLWGVTTPRGFSCSALATGFSVPTASSVGSYGSSLFFLPE